MILPDVNVLIYCLRQDLPQHAISRSWLRGIVDGEQDFGISPLSLAAAVRLATNPRIFSVPTSLDEAFGFCEDLLFQPNCRVVEPGPRHWDIFKNLCTKSHTTGARVTDAWYAALAIEWDCEWITFDRDFARFPDLKWRIPD